MPTTITAAQVAVRFLKNGSQVENVFHVFADLPLTQAVADSVHAVVDTWVTTTLRPLQTNDTIFTEIVIEGVNQGDNRFVYPGDNGTGSIANSQSPDNVTIAIKKNVAARGRGVSGRFFHIGINVNQINNSRVNAAYMNGLIAGYGTLATNLETEGNQLVVMKYNKTTHPPTPVSYAAVTSVSASDNIIDSQRRRLPGRGR